MHDWPVSGLIRYMYNESSYIVLFIRTLQEKVTVQDLLLQVYLGEDEDE